MNTWHIWQKGGRPAGPYTQEQLVELLRSGVLHDEDRVFRKGGDGWVTVAAARAVLLGSEEASGAKPAAAPSGEPERFPPPTFSTDWFKLHTGTFALGVVTNTLRFSLLGTLLGLLIAPVGFVILFYPAAEGFVEKFLLEGQPIGGRNLLELGQSLFNRLIWLFFLVGLAASLYEGVSGRRLPRPEKRLKVVSLCLVTYWALLGTLFAGQFLLPSVNAPEGALTVIVPMLAALFGMCLWSLGMTAMFYGVGVLDERIRAAAWRAWGRGQE